MEKTRSMKFAEMKATGEWKLVNYFALTGPLRIENGVLTGPNIVGFPTGKPLCVCGVCGYSPLVHHFTVKDRKTGEVINVGEICLSELMNTKRADAIVRGYKSAKRKSEGDFKRKIYFEQLTMWLDENYKHLNELRNKRIDRKLKEDPEYFWLPKTRKVVKTENGRPVPHPDFPDDPTKCIFVEIPIPEAERKKDASYYERRARNYWLYTQQNFKKRHWNPKTMYKSFITEKEIVENNIEVPKMRKMTDEEKKTMAKTTHEKITTFLKRLGVLEEEIKIEQ